jgi:hypothetical protein
MAKVYNNDITNMINLFGENNEVFDHIIAEVPSFVGRWGGAQGLGKIRDCVSACADIAKNHLSADGRITISATGVAQERWDEWMEAEGNTIFELVPDSTWAMFRPTAFKSLGNRRTEHFWHRRDDWTHVRTYRKIGSDYTVDRAAWPEFRHVRSMFADFPFPDSMNDVEMSAFRAPVHKGLNEAKEFQKWMLKKGIEWDSVYRDDGVEIPTAISDPGHFAGGYIIQFSTDPADWYHIPKTIYNTVGTNINFNNAILDKFDDTTRPGLRNLRSGNHRHVMLSSWLVATHTKVGDRILDPFCGMGSTVAAAIINERDIVGVEVNDGRASNAQRVIQDLS